MSEAAIQLVKKRMNKELTNFANEYNVALSNLTLSPGTTIVKDVLWAAIAKTAEQEGVDLIVIHSRTHSWLSQMIISLTLVSLHYLGTLNCIQSVSAYIIVCIAKKASLVRAIAAPLRKKKKRSL